HAKARVGLIDAEAINRLLVGEPPEGRREVDVQRGFPNSPQQALDQVVNVFALDERHLDIDLGELELAIGALILVAETAGDLIVTLDAGDHKDLLELLRGLRQGVESAGLAAIGNQKLARAFGRAL